jgi:hypothetical protein
MIENATATAKRWCDDIRLTYALATLHIDPALATEHFRASTGGYKHELVRQSGTGFELLGYDELDMSAPRQPVRTTIMRQTDGTWLRTCSVYDQSRLLHEYVSASDTPRF